MKYLKSLMSFPAGIVWSLLAVLIIIGAADTALAKQSVADQVIEKVSTTGVDKLSGAAGQVLQYALDSAKAGGQFVAEQAPLYFTEYVRYMAIEAALYVFIGLILFGAGSVLFYKNYKERFDDCGPTVNFFATARGIILIFFGGKLATENTLDLAKAVYAPRVLVIEKLSNLVK